ncbi:MAG: methylamine utilization protein [Gammaproteobacteria bacterium]
MKAINWNRVAIAWALVLLVTLAGSHLTYASEWSVVITDENNQPLKHAAVILSNGDSVTPLAATKIAQHDAEFIPAVSIVAQGSAVSFPNFDRAKHHVYSFSKAKAFELELFKGNPAEPVLFDTPGIVTMGCNMHDWMYAVTYIVDSPYAALTDEKGLAVFTDLPNDRFELAVWHPRHPQKDVVETILVSEANKLHSIALPLRVETPRPQRPKPIARRSASN